MFGVDFTRPWALLAILLAIPAVWWSSAATGRVVFSSLRALPAGGHTWRTRLAWLPDAGIAIAVIACAIALAGPRKGDKTSRVRSDGIAIVLAVDVSGSMRALDLSSRDKELTRLDAVKALFERFVVGGKGLAGREDDAIGLVAFARYAETRSPPTLDHGNLVTAARQLDFAQGEDDGTSVGNGLALAVQRLATFPAASKVAILLTDGKTSVRDKDTIDEDVAIDAAKQAHVKVYTIGAGTKEATAPIKVDSGEYMRARVEIDEPTLRRIADQTGGQYFRATDLGSLAKIYQQIDSLERTKLEEERFLEYHQYFDIALAVAMLAFVAALLLRGTVFRRLP